MAEQQGPGNPSAPWCLNHLSAARLRAELIEIDRFVRWLTSLGIPVPECWARHDQLVYRLSALSWWWAGISANDARGAESWWEHLGRVSTTLECWTKAQRHRHEDAHGDPHESFVKRVATARVDEEVA